MSVDWNEDLARQDWFEDETDELRYAFMVKDIPPAFLRFLEVNADMRDLSMRYALLKPHEFANFVNERWIAKGRASGGADEV